MTSFQRAAPGCALALLLAGCQVSTDPHEGGFFGGIAGLAQGGYQRRLDYKQAEFASSVAANRAMRDEQMDLQGVISARQAEIGRLRTRLARLQSETTQLQRDAARMADSRPGAELDATRQDADAARQRIADLQRRIAANADEAAKYRKELDEQRRELTRLQDIYARLAATR